MGTVFETTDIDAAESMLREHYGVGFRIDARGQRRGMRLTRTCLGPVRLDQLSFAMSFNAHVAPLGALVFCEVTSGRIDRGSDSSRRAYWPGDVYLTAQPDHRHTTAVEDTELNAAVIDADLPGQVADTAPGRSQQPVRFTGYEPVSAQAAQTWKTTYALVHDTIATSPDATAHPLVTSNGARLLVATALVTFPNNALTDPTTQDRHDAHPGTVHRATAFIDEHAHKDITIADIAAAAFVTIRAVQLAFRRHLDTTPTEYLRRVRLDHAHRDLVAADPAH